MSIISSYCILHPAGFHPFFPFKLILSLSLILYVLFAPAAYPKLCMCNLASIFLYILSLCACQYFLYLMWLLPSFILYILFAPAAYPKLCMCNLASIFLLHPVALRLPVFPIPNVAPAFPYPVRPVCSCCLS